jgi:hypothetical protein
LSGPERRLLTVLLAHGRQRGRALQEPASVRWAAEAASMDPSSAGKVLRRLGVCGVVLNLGNKRAMDLAINGDLGAWDMDLLHQLRRDRSRKVSAEIRGRERNARTP